MPVTPITTRDLANALGYDLSQLTVTIAGGVTLFSGSGVPSAGLGQNGDVYFRSDTPGTLAQRQYIKSAGAWVNAYA